MPSSYNEVKAPLIILQFISSLSKEDKGCLRKIFDSIVYGQYRLIPHPTRQGLYLPVVECNYTIIFIDNIHNKGELNVIDIKVRNP